MYKLVNNNDTYIVLVDVGTNTDTYRKSKGNKAFVHINDAIGDSYLKSCLKIDAGMSSLNLFDPRFTAVTVDAMDVTEQLASGTYADANGCSHTFEVDVNGIHIDGIPNAEEAQNEPAPIETVKDDGRRAEMTEEDVQKEAESFQEGMGEVSITTEVADKMINMAVKTAATGMATMHGRVDEAAIKKAEEILTTPETHFKSSTVSFNLSKGEAPTQLKAGTSKGWGGASFGGPRRGLRRRKEVEVVSYPPVGQKPYPEINESIVPKVEIPPVGAPTEATVVVEERRPEKGRSAGAIEQEAMANKAEIKPTPSNTTPIPSTVGNLSQLSGAPAKLPEETQVVKAEVEEVEEVKGGDAAAKAEARKQFRANLDPEIVAVIGDIPKACLGSIPAFTSRSVDVKMLETQGYVYCIDHRWTKVGNWYCIDIVQDSKRYFFNAKYGASLAIDISILRDWAKLIGGEP